MRKGVILPALVAALFMAAPSMAASVTIDFENLTDNGFGLKFSNDASATFPVVNIGGSNRMEVARTGAFQEADRGSAGDAWFTALAAGIVDPGNYVISYDWYVDTSLSPGNYGNFLQLATYINSGSGSYVQDFPAVKDVELTGTQLATGQVFSGTVSETFTAKYGVLGAGFQDQTFLRFGFIVNGDGAQTKVYYDNITIAPAVVPEPAAAGLLGFVCPLLALRRRR